MKKIAILGDTHFGCRNDSKVFHDMNAKFYQETFFPTLKARGIEFIVQTGDLFDRRKFINFNSLHLSKEYFFDAIRENDMYMYSYLGNHDVFYKNTLALNAPELLIYGDTYLNSVEIITGPERINIWGEIVDFFPWICEANKEQSMQLIKESKAQIAFGHFELLGFEMDAGNPCMNGMNRNELQKYDMVISGHFHHKSSDGHIYYVGSPHQMTWADYGDERGFHIFDIETRTLEFIPNPNVMFHQIEYDDTQETLDSIDNKDYGEYKDKYVKVVVKNKNSHLLFDRFINNFYKAEPADLSVVEDFTDYSLVQGLMEAGVNQAEHTPLLLDKYVDNIEMSLNKTKMKSVMRDIYIKANLDAR